MGNDSQELKIHIVSDADTKGFQQTSQASSKLKVDTSDLSDETKRSLGILPPLEDATRKHSHALEEQAEKTERGGREMRRLANEVGNMIGVTDAGALTMGKMGAAVFGVTLGLELLSKSWKAVQEGNNGAINLEVRDNRAAITAQAEALGEYSAALEKFHLLANAPETAAAADIKVLGEKLKLLQEIIKAEEAEALAALATHKEQMSPEAYAAEESRIKSGLAGKSAAAEAKQKQDEIDRREQEAAELEAQAAREKAQGFSHVEDHASNQGAARKNAEKAGASLEEIDAQIEREKRFRKWATGKAGDVPEYEGVGGVGKKAEDITGRYANFGLRDTKDVMGDLEQQRAQAQAAIDLGKRAEEQAKRQAELRRQAAADEIKAAQIRKDDQAAQTALNRENQTVAGTKAIGSATAALGQESAAEHNNTPTGTRDAQAALQAGTNAAAAVMAQIQQVGNTNKELHDALAKALADVAAENRRLAALIKNMPHLTQ